MEKTRIFNPKPLVAPRRCAILTHLTNKKENMIIIKGAEIKCKKCFTKYDISPEDFDIPETLSDERSMGYEIQYTWEYEMVCDKCENQMQIIVEGYEYPQGILNYEEFTANGCIFISNPSLEINHLKEEDENN